MEEVVDGTCLCGHDNRIALRVDHDLLGLPLNQRRQIVCLIDPGLACAEQGPRLRQTGSMDFQCAVDVLNGRRHEIGRIEDVRQDVGAAPLLVVLRAGEECEIPFAEEYLVRFDAARKILEMKLPPGLLKINAPLSEEEKQQR